MDSRPAAIGSELVKWFLKNKVSSLPRLHKLCQDVRDPKLQSLTAIYADLVMRMGYYADGSGGPKLLIDMEPAEIGDIYASLKEVVPKLEHEVRRASYWLIHIRFDPNYRMVTNNAVTTSSATVTHYLPYASGH